MKIIFNDGQELTVQDVSIQTDGGLLVKTISATEEQIKAIFSDSMTTKKMTVHERGSELACYENYTKFDAVVKYTAGILGIVMYQEEQAPEDRIKALEKENADMKEKIDQLEGCLLEMSELVYQ
nr:MAG TPA: Gamma-aminobutyric acid type B receptor(B) receptor, coiled-coil, heterodimer, SIGNALING.62A [Bacteriophage sp.]